MLLESPPSIVHMSLRVQGGLGKAEIVLVHKTLGDFVDIRMSGWVPWKYAKFSSNHDLERETDTKISCILSLYSLLKSSP